MVRVYRMWINYFTYSIIRSLKQTSVWCECLCFLIIRDLKFIWFYYRVTKIGPHNAQLIFLPPDPHDTLLDPADNKASKFNRPRSQDTTVSSEASDTLDHTLHCKHKSRACCKLKSNVQMMNSVKSKTNVYDHHRPEDSPELHCFKKTSRKVSAHANIKENARRKQSRSRLQSQLTLTKKDIQSAVDYRRKFHSYMQSNTMYKSTVMISR